MDIADQCERKDAQDKQSLRAHIEIMSKIEKAIAVPVRQIVHPAQLAIGGFIALSGLALMIAGLAPGF